MRQVTLLVLATFAILSAQAIAQEGRVRPIVVEEVRPLSLGEIVGLKPTDRIVSFDQKPLDSVETFFAFSTNTFGKEKVVLKVHRGDEVLHLSVPPVPLGIQVRHELPPEAIDLYEKGREALKERDGKGAIEWWRKAADAAEKVGDEHAAAFLWSRVGKVYEGLRKWNNAKDAFLRSWNSLQLTGGLAAKSLAASALGRCSMNLQEFHDEEEWYQSALELDLQSKYRRWAAADMTELGRLALMRGEFAIARVQFSKALKLIQAVLPGSMEVAICYNGLGEAARLMKNLDLAKTFHELALEIRERKARGTLEHAESLNNAGLVAYQRGELIEAERFCQKSLLIRKNKAPKSKEVGASLLNLGAIARARNELDKASGYYGKAERVFAELPGVSIYVAATLNNQGSLALVRTRLENAKCHFKKALSIQERIVPYSLDIVATLSNLGSTFLALKELGAAREYFDRAARILENLRESIAFVDINGFLIESHTQPFTGLIRTGLAAEDVSFAYSAMERARGRDLAKVLSSQRLDFGLKVPNELLEQRRRIERARFTAVYKLTKLDSSRHGSRIDKLLQEIVYQSAAQNKLDEELRSRSPQYASLRPPSGVTLAQAKCALRERMLLLEYVVDGEHCYVFAVTRTTCQMFKLSASEDRLRELARQFRAALSNDKNIESLGKELYEVLISPAESLLQEKTELLICPQGPLIKIPFAALISNRGKGETPKYLVQNQALTTTVSMGVYLQLIERPPSEATLGLLAFGNPSRRIAETNNMSTGPKSSDLAWAIREVEGIVNLYGEDAVALLGKEAKESAAKELAGTARILHFSCHGNLDVSYPLDSGLILIQGDGEDGLLQGWEIIGALSLQADLVVLSACETGLGKETKYEGLIGLTRALESAGARNVLVSLWAVNDASTAALMKEFYRGMRSKEFSPARALQRAQQLMIKSRRWGSPYHWSAFVLEGPG